MINCRYYGRLLLLFLLFFLYFYRFFSKKSIYISKKNSVFHEYIKNFSKISPDQEKSQLINVKTDVLSLDINLLGGNIECAELLNYKKSLNSSEFFTLLNNKKFFYKTNSGILVKKNSNHIGKNSKIFYFVSSVINKLKENQNKIKVCLTSREKNGISHKKVFILTRGSYAVEIKHYIFNRTNKTIDVVVFGELQQNPALIKSYNILQGLFNLQMFRGISYSTDANKYVKVSFNKLKDIVDVVVKTTQGWIAMQQQYFLTAWVPKFSSSYTIYLHKIFDYFISIGFLSDNKRIAPHSSYVTSSTIWIGPNLQKHISLLSKNTSCMMDYGWLWFISKPLFQLLSFFYNIFKNWGISIILITCFIKTMTYSLTKSQYLATIKIKTLQHKVEAIKEKFFNDTEKIHKEILLLYKNENINPLSGFMPTLIQMPIFLALYYVLISAIELRHAPFLWWIQDLSSYDPYFILPLLTGFSILGMQISNEVNQESLPDNKFLIFFSVLSSLFFLWFPAGLVLYYLVNNVVTIIQQHFIKKFFVNNIDKKYNT
nr:membrane protein insertase YidC [Buchnera aphidicola]